MGEGSKGGLGWEKQGVCQEGGRGEPSGTSFPRARVSSGCPEGAAAALSLRDTTVPRDGHGRSRGPVEVRGNNGSRRVAFYCFEHSKALLSDAMPFLRS